MNVLFMSLIDFQSVQERNIYTDLLREFIKNGHQMYIVSPIEKRSGTTSRIVEEPNATILKPVIGNMQKTNYLEKGISTLTFESLIIRTIKQKLSNVKFDLVIYTTPPITFQRAIKYVKQRDHAMTYLLLKDIFPQNAVDIGVLSTKGWKGIVYRYFRNKEKKLYRISDYIGCMSEANVQYVLKNNPEISERKIEVCPNSIEVLDEHEMSDQECQEIRRRYSIPEDKVVFIYGGNLGKPQGIDFLIKCLERVRGENAFFLIIGSGTEYDKLDRVISQKQMKHVRLMKSLPKEEYDILVRACDVGMILLDYRFTIPNFPSRILSYMQMKKPILAATDENTDMGDMIVKENMGEWCRSNDVEMFQQNVCKMCTREKLREQGLNAYAYLDAHYRADFGYQIICARCTL